MAGTLPGAGPEAGHPGRGSKKKVAEIRSSPTVAGILDDILTRPRVPTATYRLQFHKAFTFRDATAIVPYLRELGISDLYASPILKPRSGSPHGYDVVDPSQLNPELGSSEDFAHFAAALKSHGLGLILDTVPNHMGIGAENPWWMDVLENGPSSLYANWFDIDWHPVNPNLDGKLLLPVLGDLYGTVLENGELKLAYDEGAFFINYYDHKLPVAPRSYALVLERTLQTLVERLGEDHEHVTELRSILTAISYLPPRTELPTEKRVERHREKEIIKKRIAALAAACEAFREALAVAVKSYNGHPGDPRSFDDLDRLLEDQPYRPAFWRVASEEINYRRFFDINELAAIRVELPEVFAATHQLSFQLLADGIATGLRIDHPDGLWDPGRYFQQLQEHFLIQRCRALLGPERCPAGLEEEVAARMESHRHGGGPPPLYVVAEKILGEEEPLPTDWPVYGTTGYDFLNAVGGLFVDPANRDAFETIWSSFIGRRIDFVALVITCQKMIMLVSMASELTSLGHQLDRISERNRRYRDFTLASLIFALREIIASLLIYRTYIANPDKVSTRDRRFIEEAVEKAKDQNPRTAAALFHFVRDTILLQNIGDFREEDRPSLIDWSMKFQQLTGPVLAKGMEDTAFYVFNRLTSLNEVGGHPETFGVSVEEFHRQNLRRLEQWPGSVLTTATHDTKRSEDVRARLHVLSEIPQEWQAALDRWSKLNAAKKGIAADRPAPDANDEYLLYQTLLGAWPPTPLTPAEFPVFRQRMVDYMAKATREAKVHTSWINPEAEYDTAVRDFVTAVLPDQQDDPFLNDLLTLQRRLAFFGHYNALSQVLLKLTCPGVPDIYQGTELWDDSLVDPDNRRPVDFDKRQKLLAELKKRIAASGGDLLPLAKELLSTIADGRIKLFLLHRTLTYRSAQERLFVAGQYVPLEATGTRRQHVCAFLRQRGEEAVVVVTPRLVLQLCDGIEQPPLGDKVWTDTRLLLPQDQRSWTYRNHFTGETLPVSAQEGQVGLSLASVLRHFPVALLVRTPASGGR